MVNPKNEKLISRLDNYKFSDAVKYTEGESDEVKDSVTALARAFGNVGWFTGDIATIVDLAIWCLLNKTEK